MTQGAKYFAFISYNSHDLAWGKRLQRKLEHYRMPATLCSQHGWKRTPIKPVFFAPTDIQPGGLSEELQQRLQASRNLIVICSPHSAQSEWVGREIEYFHKLGRTKNIHFFIVDGSPNSGDPTTECFNPVVDRLGLPEILGANIHERIYRWPWLNRERAYVQLVSKLLGVEFDSIWRRHRRLLIQKTLVWVAGAATVVVLALGIWASNQPFDTEISLIEVSVHNPHLPPLNDAVVTLTLDNESKSDTVTSDQWPVATFSNIPHHYLGREVHLTVTACDWIPVDTLLPLSRQISLPLRRDPKVYGNVQFRLWSTQREQVFPGTQVTVEGHRVVADGNGYITLQLPLEEQRTRYHVICNRPTIDDSIDANFGPDVVLVVDLN